MGLSSSKTTSGPSKQALPYLKAGTDAVQSAYQNNLGNVSDVTNALKTSFDNYSVTNPSLTAANGYVNDVIGGKYLEGNPYLQGIIDDTNSSVQDRVNSLFSKAGQTGSSRQIGELGKQLSSAENNLRYTNYSDEQNRIMQAISAATGLNSANNQNLATQLALGQGLTSVGTDNANSYANALAGLWGNSTTTKSSPGLGQLLLQAGSSAANAFAASDPALKRNVEYVGPGPSGLGLYAFDYIEAPNDEIAAYMRDGRQIGVMADEVAALRPDALGPIIGGYRTVNYGAL